MTATTTHHRTFRILDADAPERTVEVHATPDEVRFLEEEGYLVRERLIQGEHLERLRAAVDELAAIERPKYNVEVANFGGLFVRNLLDRHPTFLDMLNFAPTVSVARAVLGPQVQVHAFVMRVAYAEKQNQEVEWHFHQRLIPEPKPRFFSRPNVIDNLIYLDDITLESGPLCVVPRTHLTDEHLPRGNHSDLPGQVVLTVPAGSCVSTHGGLWHKAMPPTGSGVRRLLILAYSPTWMKQIDKPGGGLTDALIPAADQQTRELLGVAGYL